MSKFFKVAASRVESGELWPMHIPPTCLAMLPRAASPEGGSAAVMPPASTSTLSSSSSLLLRLLQRQQQPPAGLCGGSGGGCKAGGAVRGGVAFDLPSARVHEFRAAAACARRLVGASPAEPSLNLLWVGRLPSAAAADLSSRLPASSPPRLPAYLPFAASAAEPRASSASPGPSSLSLSLSLSPPSHPPSSSVGVCHDNPFLLRRGLRPDLPPARPPLGDILRAAGWQALGGGAAGAAAMAANVGALMWMRTIINYQVWHRGSGGPGGRAMLHEESAHLKIKMRKMPKQYKNGGTARAAVKALLAQGGVARLYRGVGWALIQGPAARFGDTASNVGMLALLDSNPSTAQLPMLLKTLGASAAAGCTRILLMPVDCAKTTMQARSGQGGGGALEVAAAPFFKVATFRQ